MPQRSPTNLNTPRNRALAIGARADGFKDGIPFDHAAGVPAAVAGGTYKDVAEAALPVASPSTTQRKSFSVKGA